MSRKEGAIPVSWSRLAHKELKDIWPYPEMELQLLISYCQPVSVFIDENKSMKVSCHLKQAYIHFKTDYFKGNFTGKAGMVATGGRAQAY